MDVESLQLVVSKSEQQRKQNHERKFDRNEGLPKLGNRDDYRVLFQITETALCKD